MPFTFAHPAAVLPFIRKGKQWWSSTGLVAGALAPDFQYFFSLNKEGDYLSHSFPGFIIFNIPLGSFLFLLFHSLVRRPLILHLPPVLLSRLSKYESFDWRSHFKHKWYSILLSIIWGALLHICWDRFVHWNGDLFYTHQHSILFFKTWQHHTVIYTLVHSVHSLIGIALLIWWISRLPQSGEALVKRRWWGYWMLTLLGSLPVFFGRWLMINEPRLVDHAVAATAGFFSGLLISSCFYRKNGATL